MPKRAHITAMRGARSYARSSATRLTISAFATRTAWGVLPLVRLKSALFGDFMVSLPYFNYGGVLATHARAREALLQATADLARSLGVSHVELRHRSAQQSQWPARTDKVAMLLNLPAAGSRSTRSCRRSCARRSSGRCARARSACSARWICWTSSTPSSRRTCATSAHRCTPSRSSARFCRRFRSVPGSRSYVCRRAGCGGAAARPPRYRRDSVGFLAPARQQAWREHVPVLERPAACGEPRLPGFDFGRSTLDGGTFRFKRQWGAQPLQLHWHYWLAAAASAAHESGQPQVPPRRGCLAQAAAACSQLARTPHIVGKLP